MASTAIQRCAGVGATGSGVWGSLRRPVSKPRCTCTGMPPPNGAHDRVGGVEGYTPRIFSPPVHTDRVRAEPLTGLSTQTLSDRLSNAPSVLLYSLELFDGIATGAGSGYLVPCLPPTKSAQAESISRTTKSKMIPYPPRAVRATIATIADTPMSITWPITCTNGCRPSQIPCKWNGRLAKHS